MSLADLRQWLVTDEGLPGEFSSLRAWSSRMSFGDGVVSAPTDEPEYEPHWQRLLLAASILAESDERSEQDTALMIGHAAMVFGGTALVRDAGAVILSQLSNRRGVALAVDEKLIKPNLRSRLGVSELLLNTRRRLETAIAVNNRTLIDGSEFQFDLWSRLSEVDWASATAPTAAGKTFLVLNWVLSEFEKGRAELGVFLAPTRALVGEIEKQLLEMQTGFNLPKFRVASLPIRPLGDHSAPTMLVFTQERLHLFLNAFDVPPRIDLAVVDEAQKLNDGSRGVILQDAIERIVRNNEECKLVFLSPHSQNPEALLEDAPDDRRRAVVPSNKPTVTQNLILAEQKYRKPKEWTLSLQGAGDNPLVGEFELHDPPAGATESKRLSYVALALGKSEDGTLVYANGAADAEKIANQIYDGLDAMGEVAEGPIDQDLQDLSDFCRTAIHPRFQLVQFAKRGVAFHYGNMPTILRNEIERLFRIGKIRFLVCTSTLVEGVNLACRTIILRGPKKGLGNPMLAQDFWNLAGRAGRWGADFYGNIVCVDPAKEHVWPNGIPEKTAYPIRRETDEVLRDVQSVADYVLGRVDKSGVPYDEKLEPVSAYLMAWRARNGTVLDAPSVMRAANDDVSELEDAVRRAFEEITIPEAIIEAHPSITALSMQSLLNDFESYEGPLEHLLPPYPGDSDVAQGLQPIFERIDRTLAPAFRTEKLQWAVAFTTSDWMKGYSLGRMIKSAEDRAREKSEDDEVNFAKIIRETMRFIEEFARFKAPKYLSAYLDILRLHYERNDKLDEFPKDLPFDLYLEFGVNTPTMLAFIALGLSRTSAIELSDFLGRDELSEEEALAYLLSEDWVGLDIPNLVKREIRDVAARRNLQFAGEDDA